MLQTASNAKERMKLPARFIINTISHIDDKYYNFSDSDDECDVNDITKEEKDWIENAVTGNVNLANKKEHFFIIDNKKTFETMDECCEDAEIKTNLQCKKNQVSEFLTKLATHGFEREDENKYGIRNCVAVTLGLNRMKSLSDRKNDALCAALNEKVESNICHDFFGFFWKPVWVRNSESKGIVPLNKVKNFYKFFKKQNREVAEKYLSITENFDKPESLIPYRYLREYTRIHHKTQELSKKWLKNDDPSISSYFHLMDSDTESFNGVYSGYFKILKEGKIPTVMSTGYEFRNVGRAFEFASQLDRKIRVITNEYMPGGVYFPEPNTCILIQENQFHLNESFIDPKKPTHRVCESPAILTNLNKNREDVTFVFSLDNPIITVLPKRFIEDRRSGKVVLFTDNISLEFLKMGASPVEGDFEKLQTLYQSHFNIKIWWNNLFVNGCIPFMNKTNEMNIKKILKELVKGNDEHFKKIRNVIPQNHIGNVMLAHAEAVIQFREDLTKQHRSKKEQELLEMFKENEKTEFSDEEKCIIPMLLESDFLRICELSTICDTILEEEDNIRITAVELFLLIKVGDLGYESMDMKTILNEDETYLEVIEKYFTDYGDLVMEYFDHPQIYDPYSYIEFFYNEFDISCDEILNKLATDYHDEGDPDVMKIKARRYNLFLKTADGLYNALNDKCEYATDSESDNDSFGEEAEDNYEEDDNFSGEEDYFEEY